MKELEFIETIKSTLSKNSLIGDDCAYLKKLGIVVTQDSLVEDIHFSTKLSTPYQLGYKAITVNLSDIYASGAIPKYVTISLSLPKNIDNDFVKDFYCACEDLSNEFDFEIIGGDITGADKLYISVCAIGTTKNRNISSRSYARQDDYVITTGNHGSSTAGLYLLKNKVECYDSLKHIHLMPQIQKKFADEISVNLKEKYAMMDTSDGLIDALFKIAQASNVSISADFEKIPYDNQIKLIANIAGIDFKDWVLYGGEDYQLVACVSEDNLSKLDKSMYTIIGHVTEQMKDCSVEVKFPNRIEKITNLDKTFNHFNIN